MKLPADLSRINTLVLAVSTGQGDVIVSDRTGLVMAHAVGSHTFKKAEALRNAMHPERTKILR